MAKHKPVSFHIILILISEKKSITHCYHCTWDAMINCYSDRAKRCSVTYKFVELEGHYHAPCGA